MTNIAGLTQGVVASLLSSQKMFTAYDVTRLVRAVVGRGVDVTHVPVRDAVHHMYKNGAMGGDYMRTSMQVGDNGEGALVYHHYADNPQDYVNSLNVATATVVPPVNSTLAPKVIGGPKSNTQVMRQTKTNERTLDRFGRLRVPTKVLSSAGFGAGDIAYVVVDANGAVTLNRKTPTGKYKTYVVDCYNNIRMKLSSTASKYSFDAQQDKVVANPVP